MPAFSPQAALKNMAASTTRRFFRALDPSVPTDWKDDDDVFAPTLAADAYDRLDPERKERFFRELEVVAHLASSAENLRILREQLVAHGARPAPLPDDRRGAYDFAVGALLDHAPAVADALFFIRCESLPEKEWHEFEVTPGGSVVDRDPPRATIGEFTAAVKNTWSRGSFDLGRTVEFDYRLRGGRTEYWFGEVSDWLHESRECEGGRFVSRMVSQAKGVAIIYDRESRILRAGTTVPRIKVPSVAENWARVVKGGTVRGEDDLDTRAVLRFLADPDAELYLDPEWGIESVRRSAVFAKPIGRPRRRLGCEDDQGDALAGFVEDVAKNRLAFGEYAVTKVKLEFVLVGPDGRRHDANASVDEKKWSASRNPIWAKAAIHRCLKAWGLTDEVAA